MRDRTHLFVWLKLVRTGGLEALLERAKPGPREGTRRGVPPEVMSELAAWLAAHEFADAEQARRWLKKVHGIERPYGTVWGWLKKLHGVPRVPRPVPLQARPRRGGGLQKRGG